MTHDYKRQEVATLFAAHNVVDRTVMGQCQQRQTHAEWLKFLRKIDCEAPKDKTLHLHRQLIAPWRIHKRAGIDCCH